MQQGEYLLSHVGFSPNSTPRLVLQQGETLIDCNPLGQTISLHFMLDQRYCRGWHDLETGKDAACPESQIIDPKYEQCPACQKRTGFNPAFYHATSVSPQQEIRNQQPHFLYLAYFADNVIKVGISYAARGNSRLLEQGARSAVLLDTFPTAHIARHYEAKIAELPNIYETIQLSKKIVHLNTPQDHQQASIRLTETRKYIEDSLKIEFAKNNVEHFDATYFPNKQPNLASPFDCSTDHRISGKIVGMLGSLLFCEYQDVPVFLPLKKYIGYRATIADTETPLNLPAQQTSLF
jgi:hypothetical protein